MSFWGDFPVIQRCHHLLLFIFTSKSPQNDISVWLENLPKTTFLHESIFCFQIPKSPQNDIFRSNFTRLDSLLFFFLHHLLLFIFTSKSPQNDISVWLENLPKTTFLHESIFCFQIPKSPQNDIFRSNFTRLDSLLFFFSSPPLTIYFYL